MDGFFTAGAGKSAQVDVLVLAGIYTSMLLSLLIFQLAQ
jgi:hypothetical protein